MCLKIVEKYVRSFLKKVGVVFIYRKFFLKSCNEGFDLIFDEEFYLKKNNDVAISRMNPKLHYILYGWKEGRDPSPLFITNYYLSQLHKTLKKNLDPISHYILYGAKDKLNPHPLFDSRFYKEAYEVKFEPPLIHYLKNLNNNPHPLFDVSFYRKNYQIGEASDLPPISHYLSIGIYNDFKINKDFTIKDLSKNGILEKINVFCPDVLYNVSVKNEDYFPSLLSLKNKYAKMVDIIIPVYRDLSATKKCIESVLGAKNNTCMRLIIINDKSPENEVTLYLNSLKVSENLLVITNKENLGFVASVNLGMSQSKNNDVLLLNSDTEVSNFWLDRIVSHVELEENVGTIAPFSNNSTICNYPTFEGFTNFNSKQTVSDISDHLFESNKGRAVCIPTSVGFCMFIKRECLNDVGLFDVKAFGKGYGEENDFCERALSRGWKHFLAVDVFVYHEGEKSFKESSNIRKLNSHAILIKRYPLYDRKIASFFSVDSIFPFRISSMIKEMEATSQPKFLLFVLQKDMAQLENLKIYSELKNNVLSSNAKIVSFIYDDEKSISIKYESKFFEKPVTFNVGSLNSELIRDILLACNFTRSFVANISQNVELLSFFIKSINIPFDVYFEKLSFLCPLNLECCKKNFESNTESNLICNRCLEEGGNAKYNDIILFKLLNRWLTEEAENIILKDKEACKYLIKIKKDIAKKIIFIDDLKSIFNKEGVSKNFIKREDNVARYKITLLPSGPATTAPDASGYIRCILPFSHPSMQSLLTPQILPLDSYTYFEADIVVCNRTSVSTSQQIDKLLKYCRKHRAKLIYDLDDDLFDLPLEHPEHELYVKMMEPIREIISEAHQVRTTTALLKEKLSLLNNNVVLVPNLLDETIWGKPELKTNNKSLNLLYMGTCSHNADFDMIKPALRKLKSDFQDKVKIFVIGVTTERKTEDWFEFLCPSNEIALNYPAFVNWIRANNIFDIGLAPLVKNTFNRSKSYIKFLDYSALGLVTVASDIDSYQAVIRDGENGHLVRDDWYSCLSKLLNDFDLMQKEKEVANGEFEAQYTLKSKSEELIKLVSHHLHV